MTTRHTPRKTGDIATGLILIGLVLICLLATWVITEALS